MQLIKWWNRVVAAIAATTLLPACTGSQPLHMNDYQGFGLAQTAWPVSRQMYFVVPVPSFNQPVQIQDVELRTVFSTGIFDRPAVFLLAFKNGEYYTGDELTDQLDLRYYYHVTREPLTGHRFYKLNKSLSLVIPVNIHSAGCHEAQVVLRVRTGDGSSHVEATRWYVALDSGVTKSRGIHLCTPVSR